jgi:lysozyme
MFKGIDISTWQKSNKIDYDELAKQIDFAILRLGYTGSSNGVSWAKDTEFDNHYRELTKRGVPIGVYWFSRANSIERGINEANTVLSLIKGLKLEFPIYWDTEDTVYQTKVSRQVLTDTAKAFCGTIEKAGYYVGIYASTSWLNNRLDMSQLQMYDVWVAQYHTNVTYKGRYGMWQYTDKGRLNGYDGDLDLNISYRDYKKIITNAGLNHIPEELPPLALPICDCLSAEEVKLIVRTVVKEEIRKVKWVAES